MSKQRFTKKGTGPVLSPPRKQFHHRFGGVVSPMSDFNVDAGLWMPDQVDDNAGTACVGYTVADILTDITKTVRDPLWHYAAALKAYGSGPSIAGVDAHAGMWGAVLFGSLTLSGAPKSLLYGELYASDWDHWSDVEKRQALATVQDGTLNALGLGSPFQAVLSAARLSGFGISVATPWYWGNADRSGILPMPKDLDRDFSWHNWAIKGQKTINGIPYIIGKPWQGSDYGDNGWVYLSDDVFNAIMGVPGSAAMAFNPGAIRWLSIVAYLVMRNPFLLPYLPKLIQA